MKQSSISTDFRIAEPFNLDYVIHSYQPKIGLSSPVFTMKILVAEIFGYYPANIFLFKVNNKNTSKGVKYVPANNKNTGTTSFWCLYS